MNIAKTFDTINFKIVLQKLARFGLEEKFFKFFASYLVNQQERVKSSESYPTFSKISSGGPQGSIFAVFLLSVYINDQYLQNLERLQRSCLELIICRSVLGDKEYAENLIRNRLLPVSYFLVLNDLILLNKILVGLTSKNASDHWLLAFGCPKTRSSEKFFIEARRTFRKRFEDNYFNRVAQFSISLFKFNSFSSYSLHKNPCQFRREVKSFLEREAVKIFKYKYYPSGWKVFEKF